MSLFEADPVARRGRPRPDAAGVLLDGARGEAGLPRRAPPAGRVVRDDAAAGAPRRPRRPVAGPDHQRAGPPRPHPAPGRRLRAGRVGDADVGPPGHADPHHPPPRRPAQHHVPGLRRAPPGRGGDRGAPRASGLPRPDRGAAHRRVRARPPLRLDVHDGRLAGPAGLRVRPPGRDQPRPPPAAPGRGAAAPRRRVAAQGGEAGGGVRGVRRAARAATSSRSRPRRRRARRSA